ncbi:hypothetical protein SCAR479_06893 [Seiridium cardinale]|uniref:Heterokaryon incompatibility domain-containing protein n=1 Tax=Seiridium cardinale TaxID=138064 RepID=A0ABR2XSB4_9PEZI
MSVPDSLITDPGDVDEVQGKVCEVCGNLDSLLLLSKSAEELSEGDVKHDKYGSSSRRNLGDFDLSGKDGCSICSVLSKVCHFFIYENSDLQRKRVRVYLPGGRGFPEMSIDDFGVAKTIQLYTPIGFSPCWNRIPVLPELLLDRQSSASLDFIRSCLQSCVDHHQSCRSPASRLPTRVLDVGIDHGSRICLIKTDTRSFEPYIALSYCWGQDGSLKKTTRENMSTFESGIDIQELPVVFRECIALSRSLGIRYVWIDALCIIQDDRQDWEKESSRMSDTYAQAFLTIGASMSASTSKTFLRISPEDTENEEFSKEISFNGKLSELRARKIPEVGIHSRWTDYHERGAYRSEPWSQRGWTLQEQLLSPRLLIFTSSEIQWTCQESQKCECRSLLNQRRLFGGHSWADIDNASVAFSFWHKAVENYSIRALTHSADRLPALSGIAQAIQKRTGSKYVAGLWSDNIAEDLLWERVGDLKPMTSYQAPSFSWASIDGEIDYRCYMNGRHLYQDISQVLSLDANIHGCNQFGTVRDGAMRIRGPLTSAKLARGDTDGLYSVDIAGRNINFQADTVLSAFICHSEDGNSEAVACRYRTQMEQLAQTTTALHSTVQVEHGSRASKMDITYSVSLEDGARCWLLSLGFYLPPHSSLAQVYELLVLGKHPERPEDFESSGSLSHDHPFVFDEERFKSICIFELNLVQLT